MPSAVFVPAFAITATGREVPFPVLAYSIYDLRVHNKMTMGEWHDAIFWINSYRDGGAMPGDRKFRSPYSGERVLFTQFLDDVFELFHIASGWNDLTDTESEEEEPTGDEVIDLYHPWPEDIGRFALFAIHEWVH